MISVFINGILQAPGIDYVAGPNQVAFHSPPSAGSLVQINQADHVLVQFRGDGFTYLYQNMQFDMGRTERLYDLMKDALKYSNKPAVADALEQLQVIVELTKENDSLRKW